jgi:hypothetical protein
VGRPDAPEDFAVAGVGDQLDKTSFGAERLGFAVGQEGELPTLTS